MLIGLAGYARAGKDTVASVFEEHGFARLSFASALKDELAELEGIPREWLDDPDRKEPYRDKMVLLGAGRRAEDPDYWVDALRPQWLEADDAVIADCRYLNELAEVHDNDGLWFWIVRYVKDNGSEFESKPANEEERRSFGLIQAAVESGDLPPPAETWRAASGHPDELRYLASRWIRENVDPIAQLA